MFSGANRCKTRVGNRAGAVGDCGSAAGMGQRKAWVSDLRRYMPAATEHAPATGGYALAAPFVLRGFSRGRALCIGPPALQWSAANPV